MAYLDTKLRKEQEKQDREAHRTWDLFAAAALTGVLSSPAILDGHIVSEYTYYTERACEIADEMCKARADWHKTRKGD